MAFEKGERTVEADKAILLMTVTLKNNYRKAFQPHLFRTMVDKPNARIAADRLIFGMDDKGKNETDTPEAGNTYLLRLPVPPGPYQIHGLVSRAGGCPIICGQFLAPLLLPVEAKGPGVFYLGHVAVTVRERQGDEFRAGPLTPLVDQAVTGAWNGTYDIEVSDRFAVDEATFRSRFPALDKVDIQKALLPSFDRAASQKWWETNARLIDMPQLPQK